MGTDLCAGILLVGNYVIALGLRTVSQDKQGW